MRPGQRDSGYVGELFPLSMTRNHGPEDGGFIPSCKCHDAEPCYEPCTWYKFMYGAKTGMCRPGLKGYDAVRCLYTECNAYRWYRFEVLQGQKDWTMT